MKKVLILFLFPILSNCTHIPNQIERSLSNTINDNCIIEKNVVVNGTSMQPKIKDQAIITIYENYYACGNAVNISDIIIHDYKGEPDPVLKIVKATSEDIVEIVGNQLKINNELMKNSVNEVYVFNNPEIRLLSLYIKDNHIPENSYLIFGDNISFSTDSRKFGAVSSVDFLGKLKLMSNE